MREAQPFFRNFDGWWYVWVRRDGKRKLHKLTKGKSSEEQARLRYHAIMAVPEVISKPEPQPNPETLLVPKLLDDFLTSIENGDPKTFAWYKRFLSAFSKTVPTLPVSALKPSHVTKWADSMKTWGPTTRRSAISAVQRAFNWALEQEIISQSPIPKIKKPTAQRRETIIPPKQFDEILDIQAKQPITDLLNFLWLTGCRVQEACTMTIKNFDGERIIFKTVESKGKRHRRVIFLTPESVAIVERRIGARKSGNIFLTTKGTPWRKDSINCLFRRIRSKVGDSEGICAYSIRHSYATYALQRGVDPITLSVLMGHSDASTLAKVYQHLAKNPAYLLEQAKKAIA